MARPLRPYAPGCALHVTARIQNKEPLFTEDLRDAVADAICTAAAFSGSHVCALTVMPNHFHIVVRQGRDPIGWMMQCAMQRSALLVQRAHNRKDHVFGRRYWSCVCDTPNYLRHAIVYTHLNPWKAKLCASPCDYKWTSRAYFNGGSADAAWTRSLDIDRILGLFAVDSADRADCHANYEAFEEYAKSRYLNAVLADKYLFESSLDTLRPLTPKGDDIWAAEYFGSAQHHHREFQKHDVADRAGEILRKLAPDCSLDTIRQAGRVKELSRIRRHLIAALLTLGYRGAAIARCLCVSQALVSDVARELRNSARLLS